MKCTRRPTRLALAALLVLVVAVPAGAQAPFETDIAYEVLTDATNEPLSLEIADDGRLIWAQRDGLIWVLSPSGVQTLAGRLPVACNLSLVCEVDPNHRPTRTDIGGVDEGGLHGVLLAKDFDETGRIFTYRSIPGSRDPETTMGVFRLSTFVMDHTTNLIDLSSEETVLEVPAEWDHCCHYGGDLDYLPDGTITLTTGDDALAEASEGYGPRDHRNFWTNAELTSANPADRRGKILRLREDGSVPDGTVEGEAANPFIGMEGYIPQTQVTDEAWVEFDPYVYSMGWKQPWRAVVHPSGVMYVSDIGPDSAIDDPERGPVGYEEINMVPAGGGDHNGWPRCGGPNKPYIDVNWETGNVGDALDCSDTALIARPIGSDDETEWVRGMHGAEFYYPSGASDEWPIVGTGGKTSEPVAFYPADTTGALRLPERYNDRLFVLEWSRNYILTIPANADGTLDLDNDKMSIISPPQTSVNPGSAYPTGTVSVMQGQLMSPSDGKVGPDGAFYFLEYGATFYAGGNGRVSRIKCAECAPADASLNYGLPVEAATTPVANTAGPGGQSARDLLLLGAGLALSVAAVRRQRVRS